MRFFVFQVLLLFIFSNCWSQCEGPITPSSNKKIFQLHDIELTPKQVFALLLNNPDSEFTGQKAKNLHNGSQFFNFLGGMSILYLGVTLGANGSPDFNGVWAGAGTFLIAALMRKASRNKTNTSVDIYNTTFESAIKPKNKLGLGISPNGIGLQLNF